MLEAVATAKTKVLTGDPSSDVDLARAQLWQLIGLLLRQPPGTACLQLVAALEGDGSPLGEAIDALAAKAAAAEPARIEREYHHLFIGVGRGELLPYASYYLTGFLHEKPLALLRADMKALGIERAPGQSDPEDHMASLAEIMSGLIAGTFEAGPFEAGTDKQWQFFERHLAPWAERFFDDLERTDASDFYRPVGTLGRQFVTIEKAAYALDGGLAA